MVPAGRWVDRSSAGLAASPSVSGSGGEALAGEDFCLTLPLGNRASRSPSLQLQAMLLPEVSPLFRGQGKGRAHRQAAPATEGQRNELGARLGGQLEQQDL